MKIVFALHRKIVYRFSLMASKKTNIPLKKKFSGKKKFVGFMLPISMIKSIKARAKKDGVPMSEFIQDAVDFSL